MSSPSSNSAASAAAAAPAAPAAAAPSAPSFAPTGKGLLGSVSAARARTQWDRCLENGAIKTAWGGFIGAATGFVLFRQLKRQAVQRRFHREAGCIRTRATFVHLQAAPEQTAAGFLMPFLPYIAWYLSTALCRFPSHSFHLAGLRSRYRRSVLQGETAANTGAPTALCGGRRGVMIQLD
jgi:hypothetical protein